MSQAISMKSMLNLKPAVLNFDDQKQAQDLSKIGNYWTAPSKLLVVNDAMMTDAKAKLWTNYNDHAKITDASYALTSTEVEALNQEIAHVLRWDALDPIKTFPKINVGKGIRKWYFYQWQNVQKPKKSLDFERTATTATAKEEAYTELHGFHYDFYVSMTQLDVQQNTNSIVRFGESYQQGLVRELTAQLLETSIWSIFRGGDIPGYIDDGKTGLVNDANLTDPGAMGLGGDDDLTASGDIPYSVHKLCTKLMTAKFPPPYELHLTPGVYAQAIDNFDSTNKIFDIELLQKDVERGLISRIVVNPFLIDSETETNSTGAMMVCKPGTMTFSVIESYPLGLYPLPPQSLGIEGKILWMGGVELRRPASISYADSLDLDVLAA